jgi:elongation factor Ts
VLDKIADGKVGKFYEQVCLVDQLFVKNPEQKVSDVLAARGKATVKSFVRFKLGEGAGAKEK